MRCRIAYIVSRFPEISEAFIVDEVLDLRRRGLDVEILSLAGQLESRFHRHLKSPIKDVHYSGLSYRGLWLAQLYWMSKQPALYFRCWWKAVHANLWSLAFLLRALFVVPAATYFALMLLKERQVEHVHAHGATFPALAAYIIHQLTGITYSLTVHDNDTYINKSRFKEILSDADFIVTNSKCIASLLTHHSQYVANKVHVIHGGIDPDLLQPVMANPNAAPARPFTILCVASLNEYKGHRYLLEACANLKQHGIAFQCLLTGEGPGRRGIEAQLVNLRLSGYVHLLGWHRREEIYTLMQHADVVVLPSMVARNGKQEGIPVALMEAMAMELPVVATAISGIPELVDHGKNGLLVPEKNSGALAAALYLIYTQQAAAREMARAGRAKVLTEFNLHVNAGRLYRMFTGLERRQPVSIWYQDWDSLEKERGAAC